MTTGPPLYLVTACSSPEEFVAAFRRYTDRTGLFVPCASPLPAGKRGRIAVTLRDGSVMIEGEAEIVSSSAKPSALYGRLGMTIRFVEPDDPSKTLLGELERARIALKPVAPTVAPRPAEVPAEPRPVAPAPGGRIDAANALAQTVAIGDVSQLRDTAPPTLPALAGPGESGRMRTASTPPPLKASQKFVLPSIPAKAPTKPPPLGDPRPATGLAVPGLPSISAVPSVPVLPRTETARAVAPPPPVRAQTAPPVPVRAETAPIADVAKPDPIGDTTAIVDVKLEPTTDGKAERRVPEVEVEADPVIEPPTPAPALVAPLLTETVALDDIDEDDADDAEDADDADDADDAEDDAADVAYIVQPAAIPDEPLLRPRAKNVTATQLTAVVPPPERAPRPPIIAAAPPKPIFVVTEPDEKTDLTEVPLEPPSDAIPQPAPVDTRKTSLGIAAIMMAPAPPTAQPVPAPAAPSPLAAKRRAPTPSPVPATPDPAPVPPPASGPDTAVMTAEPIVVVGNMNVDAHASTIEPNTIDVDILAAASGMSGDWTMTPDAVAPVPLAPMSPPAPPGSMSGDWIISTDAEAQDGWSAPSKVQRAMTNTGIGPPMLQVSSSQPLSSEPKREPVREVDGPKVQIDPTLIEALPDLDRLAASSSGDLALGAPAPASSTGTFDIEFSGASQSAASAYSYMHGPGITQAPGMPAPPLVSTLPGMGAGQPDAPAMMQLPSASLPRMMTPPLGMLPPLDQGMPLPPSSPAMSMSPPLGMVVPTEAERASGHYTPPPGFMPSPPPMTQSYVDPAAPAQYAMPTAAQLAVGDSTAVHQGRGGRIALVVVVLLLAIGGGVYLVTTTGGGRSTAPPPPPGRGSAVAAIAHAQTGDGGTFEHGEPPIAPPINEDARPAVASPPDGAGAAVIAPDAAPPATGGTCTVNVVSVPSGADVVVGGAVAGHTPAALELPCGVESKLVFRKAPLVSQTRTVTPKNGAETTLRAVLVKQVFSLKVSSTPAGAAITINGKASGVTPSNVKLPGFEPATVVMTKAGFESYTEKITPKQNAETVHGTLKRKGK